MTQCDRLLGDSREKFCNPEAGVDAMTDTCGAIAISECDNDCQKAVDGFPHLAHAFGGSQQEAEAAAIRRCSDDPPDPASSPCQIATDDTDQRAVACVGTAGTTTSPAPQGVWIGPTPPTETEACFFPSSSPAWARTIGAIVLDARCTERVVQTHDDDYVGCGEVGESRRVCPRTRGTTTSEYSTIAECARTDVVLVSSTDFSYLTVENKVFYYNRGSVDLNALERACEDQFEDSHRFTILKPQQQQQ